jgi:hypothetical protein
MQRLKLFLIASGVLFAGLALAQEPPAQPDDPPVRLKKKPKADAAPQPEPDKPPTKDEKKDPPKKDDSKDEPEPPAPQEDEAEVLNRVTKNVRLSEEKLANKELTDGTRQLQDDILKDLDSLIKSAENPPPQGSGGGGGEDNQQGQSDNKQGGGMSKQSGKQGSSQGGGSQRASRGRRDGSSQANKSGSGSQGKQGTQTAKGDPSKQGGQPKQGSGNMGGGGDGKPTDPLKDKNADLYKDVWGHLPEALRAEMMAYSNDKQFMAKYDELIKRYYRSIAEQGRRKGD